MSSRRKDVRAWLRAPALLALLVVLAIHWQQGFHGLELQWLDQRAAFSRHVVDTDLVIVEIDAQSLHRLQTWPWPRRYHAQVLDRLREAGARAVFYDVAFSSSSDAVNDEALAGALSRFPVAEIYLPAFVQRASSTDHERVVLVKPLPMFERHASLVSVNVLPDQDGLVRRVAGAWTLQGEDLISAAAAMAGRTDLGRRHITIDYGIDPIAFPRLSFADVLGGAFDPAQVRDRNVIVGATAIELGDMLPVPLHRSLPGPVVQALAYQSALDDRLRPAPRWLELLLLALLAGVLGLAFRRWDWRVNLVLVTLLTAAVGGLSVYLHQGFQLLLTTTPAAVLPAFAYLLFLFSFLNRQRLTLLMQSFALRRKDALMSSIVEYSQDGILTVNGRGVVQSANPAARALLQLHDATTEVHLYDLLPALADNGSSPLQWLSGDGQDGLRELRAAPADGRALYVEVSVNTIAEHEDLYTVFIRDVTERVRQRQVLEFQATHDALTGLCNRYLLNQRLRAATAPGGACALLMVDLDRFKEINDTLGHDVGDQLLKQVSSRLARAARDSMTLARLGGDEFALLAPGVYGRDEAEQLARQILAQLEEPFTVAGAGLGVQATIGAARFPADADDGPALMRHADLALYAGKRSNQRLCHFQEHLARDNAVFMTISTGLRQAIAQSELHMVYQPKWDPTAEQVVGAEALLRWQHPEIGFISPQHVIEVAENTPLIWPLTEWTLMRALRDAHQWRERGCGLAVAVNLSARLLQDPGLAERVLNCLQRAEAAPHGLILEITESGILSDPEAAMRNLSQLRAASVAVSIDDFGTGYSSLSYLKNLRADELKIDRSFIVGMAASERDALIVRSTVDLAHSLGLKVVAEGVETIEMMAAVKRAGCDLIQGYGVAKPMPNSELLQWLSSRSVRRLSAAASRAGAG